MKKKKIPYEIWKVLEDRSNFYFLYLARMDKDKKGSEVYDGCISEIRQYAPKFKMHRGFDIFSSMKHGKMKDVEVPIGIINAVAGDFDKLMDLNLKVCNTRKAAYDKSVKDIQVYFPKHLPFSNYASYKRHVSYHHHKNKRNKTKTR